MASSAGGWGVGVRSGELAGGCLPNAARREKAAAAWAGTVCPQVQTPRARLRGAPACLRAALPKHRHRVQRPQHDQTWARCRREGCGRAGAQRDHQDLAHLSGSGFRENLRAPESRTSHLRAAHPYATLHPLPRRGLAPESDSCAPMLRRWCALRLSSQRGGGRKIAAPARRAAHATPPRVRPPTRNSAPPRAAHTKCAWPYKHTAHEPWHTRARVHVSHSLALTPLSPWTLLGCAPTNTRIA